jgi:hypothetical protein
MADISKWDDEYEEMVLEFMYGCSTDYLVDWVLKLMTDTQVDELIDELEGGKDE